MWCRPDPSSVSPIYMPGRLRTASRPFRTLIASAPYSAVAVKEGVEASVIRSVTGSSLAVCRRGHLTRLDAQESGIVAGGGEQQFIGAGHEGLGAELAQLGKEPGPALGVEMGDHLVQQEQRGMAVEIVAHRPGMGQDGADQQGLLLAGGAVLGSHVLGAVRHQELAAMRTGERPAGRLVEAATVMQDLAIGILGLDGRPGPDIILEAALDVHLDPRKGAAEGGRQGLPDI